MMCRRTRMTSGSLIRRQGVRPIKSLASAGERVPQHGPEHAVVPAHRPGGMLGGPDVLESLDVAGRQRTDRSRAELRQDVQPHNDLVPLPRRNLGHSRAGQRWVDEQAPVLVDLDSQRVPPVRSYLYAARP
jgi:hypothetical protein